ncbi:response regulator transcription factor [Streptomyces sp. NPDC049627]|uniref:response regulator transcription factor n=1 Tax=Streptomyces sp. NPDC049627 TaxID=3365595 RepID=UPI0037A52402
MTIPPKSETGGASGVDTDERRILNLLYTGLNDASIARHLGVGHRTVQRKVQRLMERLQANGRVALGARAQELGLLPPAGLTSGDDGGGDGGRREHHGRRHQPAHLP